MQKLLVLFLQDEVDTEVHRRNFCKNRSTDFIFNKLIEKLHIRMQYTIITAQSSSTVMIVDNLVFKEYSPLRG